MSLLKGVVEEMSRGANAPAASQDTQQLPYTWVDGDTVKGQDGTLYRIQGFDAPEISKFIDGEFKMGTMGGIEAAKSLRNLANQTGYTNLKVLDDDAAYDRKTAILVNDRGESFTDRIIKEDVLNPTFQTEERLIVEKRAKDIFKGIIPEDEDADEFAKAGKLIKDAMVDEGYSSTNFKKVATNELERLTGKSIPGLYADDVKFRSSDRTLDNESLNPLSDSWDAGVTSMIESAYGFASLLGDSLGSEDLKRFGDAGVYRQRKDMEDTPQLLLDYKDVEGFGDAVEFVGNNLAMSLPYMGMIVASGLTAGVTGGASLAVPSAVYSGQVWNEQPEDSKNAAVAVGAGVLMGTIDRLGLKGALGTSFKSVKAGSLTTKKLYEKAIEEQAKKLVAEEGIEKVAATAMAKELVNNATKLEIGQISKEVVGVMSQQLKSKDMVMKTLGRVGQGTAFEGATEALQESIGYIGANLDGGVIDFTELGDRALSAAIAGGAVGGALGSGGAAIDYAKWADVAWRQAPASERDKIEAERYTEEEEKDHGYVRSIQQINTDVREELQEENKKGFKELLDLEEQIEKAEILYSSGEASVNDLRKLEERYKAKQDELTEKYNINTRYDRYAEKRKSMSTKDKAFDALNRIPELWRNSISSILPKETQAKSKIARELADMFGGNRNRIFSGANFESRKHHLVAKYKSKFDIDTNSEWAKLNGGKRPNSKQKAELSKKLYDIILKASDPESGKFNKDLVPEDTPNRVAITKLGDRMQELSDTMHEDQERYNKKLGYIGNYLAKFKVLDKNAVADNPERFTELLISEYGIDAKEANKVTDAIINNNEVSTVDEALEAEQDGEFVSTKGGFKPSSHNQRTLGLSENEKFQDFMEQDIFANISYSAKAAARYQANQEFVGFNGSVIGKKLDEAVRRGELTEEEADRIAYGLRNYLDAESGNYKRPETEFGKKVQNVQRNLVFFTTIAGLPLATISSIVELALTMNALNKDQIFGKDGRKGGLKQMGEELTRMLWQGSQEVFSTVSSIDTTKRRSAAQERLRDLGFYDWDVGAATKTGVTETSALKQKFIQGFFKANGLQGFTQMTRAIRLSIAGDYIFDHLDNILNSDLDSPTKGALESIRHLRDLGLDLNKSSLGTLHSVLNKERSGAELTEDELEYKDTFFREAQYNFVNQAIMLPGAANRPLWLQDPRFTMLNQFQGFISTFTSTFLPRLWGDYVKRGSPAMKYNAFATMATMVLLGFVSQEFKDRLKYGETSPYLDEAEWIRRGISSSGLLGSSERVINTLFPMYETRTDGVFDWAWNEATGQAPGLSMLSSAGGSLANFIEGDVEKGVDKLLRMTPVGPITWFRKDLAALAGGDD
jgi:hypothetical protein